MLKRRLLHPWKKRKTRHKTYAHTDFFDSSGKDGPSVPENRIEPVERSRELTPEIKEKLEQEGIEMAIQSKVPVEALKAPIITWKNVPVKTIHGIVYYMTIEDKAGRVYDVLFDANTLEMECFAPGFEV